jgi:hypothetical protein
VFNFDVPPRGSPKVDSEDFRKLRETKRTNSYREALQQAMRVISVRLVDVP